MNSVFSINEELANIAVTSTELLSTTNSIVHFIRTNEFSRMFSSIVREINKSYKVVEDSFKPFEDLNSEEKFIAIFDELHYHFKENYLLEVSKPRKYFDNVYEDYLEMQQTKEANTGYPLVKHNFIRLDKLYDKWINNDAYLAMSMDRTIKLQNNLLNEISAMKANDVEDAYYVFSAAFRDFSDYLQIIRNNSQKIDQLFED